MGYTDENGRWHSEFLTNAELANQALPADPAELAETFDPAIWGEDAGRAIAEPLLQACSNGALPESLTLLRTCLYVQSCIMRIATQDDAATAEVELLERLATAIRERVTAGAIDAEATVVAHRLTGGQPIAASVYQDPRSREPRSLLISLMTQPATTLQHPLENQLSEVLAFLLDRDESFARGFLELCAGEHDTQLHDAISETASVGARTQVSLPAPGPGGLPQRTTLYPDISIDGSSQSLQVFVEVKVDAALHQTVVAGELLEQPDAYAYAWRRLAEPTPPKTRRVCTLTRERLLDTGSDPWRRTSITWRDVAALLEGSTRVAMSANLNVIGTELASLIKTIVYPPALPPEEVAYVQQAGAAALEALVSELMGKHPDVMASGTRNHGDYVGRYLTIPANGSGLRIWLYVTPAGGRYNAPGRGASIVWAIAAEQGADWSREQIEATAGTIGLKLERDIAGYRLFRQFQAFPPGLDRHQAADHGRSLGTAIAETLRH